MIEAAVTISLRVLRMRPAGVPGWSSTPPLTRGTTFMIISKPLRPSAICGKDQNTICSQTPASQAC